MAETSIDTLSPSARRVLEIARSIAETGEVPTGRGVARKMRRNRTAVRRAMAELLEADLWPGEVVGRGGHPRLADWLPKDDTELRARTAAVLRGEDPDQDGAPPPVPAWFGRRPEPEPTGSTSGGSLLKISPTYRKLVLLLRPELRRGRRRKGVT